MDTVKYSQEFARNINSRVKRWWKMTEHRSNSRAVIVQTIVLIITLISLALAAERRVTTVEVGLTKEIETLQTVDKQHADVIKCMQDRQIEMLQTQAKTTEMLNEIDIRHHLEDQKRILGK